MTAAAVVVRPDGRGGLGLYANRPLAAGSLIFTDHPLATGLPPEAALLRCRACLRPLSARSRDRTPPCTACAAARWCDAACRADDAVGHAGSGECALLAAQAAAPGAALLAWPGLLRDACLALRLLVRTDGQGSDLATDAEEVGRRGPAAGARLAGAGAALAAAAGVGAATGGLAGSAVTPDAAARALRAAALNAVELEDVGGVPAGPADNRAPPAAAGLYPLACRANHSCAPTALFVPRRRGRLAVRALVDVPEGGEVTVSYVDPVAPRADRRAGLEAGWGFACDCRRCTDEQGGEGLLGEVAAAAAAAATLALAALEAAVDAAAAAETPPGCGRRPPRAVAEALGAAAAAALAAGVGPAHAALLRLHLLLPGACAAVAAAAEDEATPPTPSADAAVAAAAVAFLSSAIPALAADALAVAGGQTGALLFGGRAWAGVAGRALALVALEVSGGEQVDWASGMKAAVAAGGPEAPPAPRAGPPLPDPPPARAVAAALALARAAVVAGAAPPLIPLPILDASLARLGVETAPAAAGPPPPPAPPLPPPRWAVWAAAAAAAAARSADLLSFCLGEGSAVEASAFAAMHARGVPYGLAAAITAATLRARRWGPDAVVV